MATSVWKGAISFGLLSIPIRLYPAARAEHVNLHQIHKESGTRLRQPLYCPTCKRMVERSEVVKGYEYEKGKYVLLDNEELKKIIPPSGRTMEIEAFVKSAQIDPIFFESSYLAMPEKDNPKPYVLLVKALEEADRVGIARVTMHQREYTVFIRPRNHGLTIHTMYFANEIRRVPEFGAIEAVNLKPQEVKLTEQLIATMMQPFKPTQYHDEFQDRLRQLVEAKRRGQTVEVEEAAKRAPVIDMMQALKKSLASRSTPDAGAKKLPAKHRKVASKVKKAS